MRPWARIALVVVVAAIIIVATWRIFLNHSATPEARAQPQVPLAAVREGSVRQSITLVGRVGPVAGTQTKLAFSVPGSLERVNVTLGEHVAAGSALAQLDATPYVFAAAQAQAEASAANAGAAVAGVDRTSTKLRVDEAALERQRRLYHAGVVALRDVQAAQGSLAADRADLQSAHLQLAQAQAQSRAAALHANSTSYDVDRTTLRAPTEGIVVGIFVQPGQVVDTTTPIVALAPERQGLATLDVAVAELPRISVGDPVALRSDGAHWGGRIAGIAPAVDPTTGLAIVTVSGVPAAVAAGTPLDAMVTVGAVRGLVVPKNAVIEDPQTGVHLVFVAQRQTSGEVRFVSRTVSIGAQDDKFAQLTSGLRAGEYVAAEGAIDLLAP